MNISVELLNITPLPILIKAIRQCYESQDKSDSFYLDSERVTFHLGEKDEKLIKRIIDSDHTSTVEHIYATFQIKGISRLVLQELARHRIASYSVKSTRYTLKELKNEDPFLLSDDSSYKRAGKYINLLGYPEIDEYNLFALDHLRQLISQNIFSNDEMKYSLPECYKTDLIMTINMRSLKNFLNLRLSERAHFEIQELARKIKEAVPEEYQLLLADKEEALSDKVETVEVPYKEVSFLGKLRKFMRI